MAVTIFTILTRERLPNQGRRRNSATQFVNLSSVGSSVQVPSFSEFASESKKTRNEKQIFDQVLKATFGGPDYEFEYEEISIVCLAKGQLGPVSPFFDIAKDNEKS